MVSNPFGTDRIVKEALLTITVMRGDVNYDGGVNESDLLLVNQAYKATTGSAEYSKGADFSTSGSKLLCRTCQLARSGQSGTMNAKE